MNKPCTVTPRVLVLMGIKHCGKSTQGKCIAQRLGVPFYDTDDVLKKMTNLSAREIYTAKGEAAFMQAEAEACRNVVQKVNSSVSVKQNDVPATAASGVPFTAVIATGGGICKNDEAIKALRSVGVFVFLCAPEKIAADRIVREAVVAPDGTITNLPAYIANYSDATGVKKSPHSIAEVRDIFHKFYTERIACYSKIASVTVQMIDAPIAVNTQRILDAI